MLGSNNYLGLTADERVIDGARDALEHYGTGLTGSRLLNGTIPLHPELEAEIADWMGTEDALVFTTGHQANVGTLGTILGPGDTVIADSGDHASILDGCLLCRAKLRPFRHNRLDKLERALERAAGDGGGVLVVVDGVFSMEGDIAPLPEIADLCERYGARLMVDEAHGAGVLGARGAGASELLGVEDRVDLRMGTFSKSLASCGGFIAGSARGRRLPAGPVARVPLHRQRRAGRRRRRAGRAARRAHRRRPRAAGRACWRTRATCATGSPTAASPSSSRTRWPTAATSSRRSSPCCVGDDWKAVLLWRALYDAGVFVNTALHPAVPPGGALLRTSVMATHDTATLDRALDAFAEVKASFESEHGPLPSEW